jgi:ABC-type nitrate/sulfonate/bicarbonate transport system permease component
VPGPYQTVFRQADTLTRRAGKEALPAALILVLLIGGWEIAVRVMDIQPVILPAPSRVATALWDNRGLLYSDMVVTIKEILVGFALGFVGGVVLAGLIVYSRTLDRALYPLAVASQTIPVFAIAPLLVIWFGFGMLPKVLVAALIIFFPITVNTVEGLRSAEPEMIALLRSLGASHWQIFRLIQIPASLPYVVAGTQVGIAYSVIGAVIGEWVGSTNGIGARMISANSLLQTDLVFASIVVLSLVALTLFLAVALISRLAFPWRSLAASQHSQGGR